MIGQIGLQNSNQESQVTISKYLLGTDISTGNNTLVVACSPAFIQELDSAISSNSVYFHPQIGYLSTSSGAYVPINASLITQVQIHISGLMYHHNADSLLKFYSFSELYCYRYF